MADMDAVEKQKEKEEKRKDAGYGVSLVGFSGA
jgi:hypothetical protein